MAPLFGKVWRGLDRFLPDEQIAAAAHGAAQFGRGLLKPAPTGDPSNRSLWQNVRAFPNALVASMIRDMQADQPSARASEAPHVGGRFSNAYPPLQIGKFQDYGLEDENPPNEDDHSYAYPPLRIDKLQNRGLGQADFYNPRRLRP